MNEHNLTPVDSLCQRIGWQDLDPVVLRRLVRMAQAEDFTGLGLRRRPSGRGDATTRAVVGRTTGRARVVARSAMTVCGLPLAAIVAAVYGPRILFRPEAEDGSRVSAGESIGVFEGDARRLLSAERVLLNFLQRLGGIATNTAAHVDVMGSTPTRLLDTRKTTPGHRMLEKYAVACGGGWNHRFGLFDRVLIKDNHLAVAGATHGDRLADAVARARTRARGLTVEVEVDSIDQLSAVIEAGADVVLLDNFTPRQLHRAVEICRGRIRTEASGGIILRTLPKIADIGLDFISSGALVHQSTWIDIGLDWD